MKNLLFIRSISSISMWEYYELNTQAVVYGDVDGYSYFIDSLKMLRKNKKDIFLDEIDSKSNSMRVALVMARGIPSEPAQLRIIERPVLVHGKPNMELVFCGNSSGYKHLIKFFCKLAPSAKDTFSDHVHLEESMQPWIVKRSVSLNVRTPLSKWSEEKLMHYAKAIREQQATYLPENLKYFFHNTSVEDYEEIRKSLKNEYIE